MAEGRLIFVAGQVGWDAQERIVSDGFAAQAKQALHNIVAVLVEAGAGPQHLMRLTWFVTDRSAYLASWALARTVSAMLKRQPCRRRWRRCQR